MTVHYIRDDEGGVTACDLNAFTVPGYITTDPFEVTCVDCKQELA